jgi:hypothetical protein
MQKYQSICTSKCDKKRTVKTYVSNLKQAIKFVTLSFKITNRT